MFYNFILNNILKILIKILKIIKYIFTLNKYFTNNINKDFNEILIRLVDFLKKNNIKKIYIKNHPSEKKNKFKKFCKKNRNKSHSKIEIINDHLENIFNNYKYIAGYDTMALVIAKKFKCKTFNLKIKGRKSVIPKIYIDKFI